MDEHEYDPKELCKHGRHIGAVCIPCAESPLVDELSVQEMCDILDGGVKIHITTGDVREDLGLVRGVDFDVKPSGLNATYYDFPENVRSAMDLIEFLDLNFSQGNILKSLVRENNPNAKKETTALYEAEKRYYYADRDLRNVQMQLPLPAEHSSDAEEGPQQAQETG